MKLRIIIIFVFITFNIFSSAQESNSLVDINGRKIAKDEFIKRLELSPFISKLSDIEEKKKEFLLTLTAEKILAKEAKSIGLNDNLELKLNIKSLEKRLLIDKLFERKVLDQIELSQDEISRAIKLSTSTLYCNFLVSQSEEEIKELYQQLSKGIKIETLLVNREEAKDQPEPIKVEFGQMDENLESIIFNLEPNQFSNQMYLNNIWVIYLVKQKSFTPPDLNDDKFKKKIRDVLKNRKVKEYTDRYYFNLMKGLKVNADIKLFNLLTDEIEKSILNLSDNDQIELTFSTLQKLKSKLKENLKSEFIKFQLNPINLGDFFNQMSVEGLVYDKTKIKSFKLFLDNYIKGFIRSEILNREALRENLDKDIEVLETLRIWEENYLASLYRKEMLSQIKIKNSNLSNEELFEELQIEIAKLAQKYNLKINFNLLESIKVNPINTLVYKNYGFGESGIVYPQTSNFSDWYEIIKRLSKDIN